MVFYPCKYKQAWDKYSHPPFRTFFWIWTAFHERLFSCPVLTIYKLRDCPCFGKVSCSKTLFFSISRERFCWTCLVTIFISFLFVSSYSTCVLASLRLCLCLCLCPRLLPFAFCAFTSNYLVCKEMEACRWYVGKGLWIIFAVMAFFFFFFLFFLTCFDPASTELRFVLCALRFALCVLRFVFCASVARADSADMLMLWVYRVVGYEKEGRGGGGRGKRKMDCEFNREVVLGRMRNAKCEMWNMKWIVSESIACLYRLGEWALSLLSLVIRHSPSVLCFFLSFSLLDEIFNFQILRF